MQRCQIHAKKGKGDKLVRLVPITSGRFKLGNAQQTKFAKGPDGTRGFAAGRGKPIAANGSGGGGEVGA